MIGELDTDPEWGPVDLVEEIEAVFEIKISDSEAVRCETAGDLYRLVRAHRPDWGGSERFCASSLVFYEVRRALASDNKRDVTPRTLLRSVDDGRPRKLLNTIERETGLRVPTAWSTRIGDTGVWLCIGAVAAVIWAMISSEWIIFALGIALFAGGIMLLTVERGRWPEHMQTLGDVVHRTVALNASQIRARGARAPDLWTTIVTLLAEHCTVPPSEIGPDTLLLPKPRQNGRGRH